MGNVREKGGRQGLCTVPDMVKTGFAGQKEGKVVTPSLLQRIK